MKKKHFNKDKIHKETKSNYYYMYYVYTTLIQIFISTV